MSDQFLYTLLGAIATVVGTLIVYRILFYFMKKWASRKKAIFPVLLTKHIYYPGFLLVIFGTLHVAFMMLSGWIPVSYHSLIRHALLVVALATSGYLITRVILVLQELAVHHYVTETPADYSLRKAKTQFQIIQRVLNFVIIFATGAVILMTFKGVREVGSTLLTSAGVVGLIIGFAAQKSLGTLFAGIQIAISQPVRIDDTVVVENEFGTVEEITLTYVVVKTWDGRRLIVPINYFLEKSFINMTRSSPEVVSIVKIYVDFTTPVDEVRSEFQRLVNASPLWDKKYAGLVVTDANDQAMELRATMSVRNSGDSFDLACLVREKLIVFLQQRYPLALPRNRQEAIVPRVVSPKETI